MKNLKLKAAISKATIFALNHIAIIDTVLDVLDAFLDKRQIDIENVEATITYKEAGEEKTITIDKELEVKNKTLSFLLVAIIKLLQVKPKRRNK